MREDGAAVEFDPCPWCHRPLKVKYPDEVGGCTLIHPVNGCKFLGGCAFLFANPRDAAEAWNDHHMADALGAALDRITGLEALVRDMLSELDGISRLQILGGSWSRFTRDRARLIERAAALGVGKGGRDDQA